MGDTTQGKLDDGFPGFFPSNPVPDEHIGYRGASVCQIANITYRQLDYWSRTGLIEPSIRTAQGSGSQRLYSFKDILVVKIINRLLSAGISLQNIRIAVDHLRERGVEDLANLTLISDGITIYEVTSPEEITDILQQGQGVFAIAISGSMRELSGTISAFPAERAQEESPTESDAHAHIVDELASRRLAKQKKTG